LSRDPREGPPAPARRDVGVVIAAAGGGLRFGGRKALLHLAGRPLVLHSLSTFASLAEVREVVIAAPADDLLSVRERVERWREGRSSAAGGGDFPRVSVVAGGARRQDSVRLGLDTLSPEAHWVLVHDAARPLVDPGDVQKVIAAVREAGAAVLGHPATDSVKEEKEGFVLGDLPRGRIWLVQTPQGASRELLGRAYEAQDQGEVTDEAGLLSRAGARVRLVLGKRTNIKITFPEDLALAELILKNSRTAPLDL
jgi:2-C-methyl-D-erythritol 4-phosphate cytidylyltransferase